MKAIQNSTRWKTSGIVTRTAYMPPPDRSVHGSVDAGYQDRRPNNCRTHSIAIRNSLRVAKWSDRRAGLNECMPFYQESAPVTKAGT